MERRKFREEMIKLLFSRSINPDIELIEEPEDIQTTFHDVLNHMTEIDGIIEKALTDWNLARMNYVDQAIIRYAVYELVVLNQPKEIVINEALNLTKKYSNLDDDQARKFNNRLLQNIVDGLSDLDG